MGREPAMQAARGQPAQVQPSSEGPGEPVRGGLTERERRERWPIG